MIFTTTQSFDQFFGECIDFFSQIVLTKQILKDPFTSISQSFYFIGFKMIMNTQCITISVSSFYRVTSLKKICEKCVFSFFAYSYLLLVLTQRKDFFRID